MKMKRFSKSFPTFSVWKNHVGNSSYAKKIERKHYRYPDATLPQLTGRQRLPKEKLPLYKIDPRGLNPKDRALRMKTLRVGNLLRKKIVFDMALKTEGITKPIFIKHFGPTVRITRNSITIKKSDDIPRLMPIDTQGSEFTIVVTNSRDASTLGKYYNAKRKFLETGDPTELKQFAKKRIKDSDGNIYRLETDPEKIIEIEDKKEAAEEFEIYET
jgi:hypothetical protein